MGLDKEEILKMKIFKIFRRHVIVSRFELDYIVSEYKRQSTGVGDGFSRLYTYQLYEIKVALPPIDEQKEIIDYLQSICYKIETAIQEKKKQVDILNAYKKSLIYEYVTGKKEVPNEQ